MGGPFHAHKLRFVIVNALTATNLVLGVLALIAATAGSIQLAAWGLLMCVLLDASDGLLARHWCVTSEFGAQLDSLADMTSFITAGGTLIYYWVEPITPPWLISVASALYVLSGAVRLARFNCAPPQPDYFQGMPTTFVATAVAANYLIAPSIDPYWIVALALLLAVLMISLLPYPKPSPATIRRCSPWCVALLGVGAVISVQWTIWLLTAGYVTSGPAIWLRRKLDHKR